MSEKTLNPKEDAFCVHYTTIGAETYSHGTKSAIAADYAEKSAHTSAWKLLRRPAVRERIQELQADNMSRNFLTVDKILSDLENTRIKADKKGDLASAIRCSELQGKYFAAWSDKSIYVADNTEQRELDDKERAEARRISLILLNQKTEQNAENKDLRPPQRAAALE